MNINELASAHRTLALDGCDGTGKTTLAHQLATMYGFTVIHSARTPDGVDLIARYRDILTTPGQLVLDRCFVSELVYGPLRHDGSRITLGQAIQLTEMITTRDGVLVHLTGPPSAIRARLLARDGGAAAGVDEVEALVTGYEQVFGTIAGQLPGSVIRLDTASRSLGPG